MPVGRHVLDLHGESHATWPASDALCASLQVLNHVQDCAGDLRMLDRCYLPQDWMAEAGASTDDLARGETLPAMRTVFDRMLTATADPRPRHQADGASARRRPAGDTG